MANIQIKRYKESLGEWANLYPITLAGNVRAGENDSTPLVSNGKLNVNFLPDYILQNLVFGGVAVGIDGTMTTISVQLTSGSKSKYGTTENTITLINSDSAFNSTTKQVGYSGSENIFFIFEGAAADVGYTVLGMDDVMSGDWILGTVEGWHKIDNVDAVKSVNGQTGNVTINIPSELPASDVHDWAKAANKPSYTFSEIGSKPTTISGYGITDAKIANGVITLGSNSITPLTSITENQVVTALGYTPANETHYHDTRYVRFDTASQSLTDTQKSNARSNIGAGTSNFNGSFSNLSNKPTTLSGYGITDAKIASGVITLGSNTITPLTAASTLDATKLSGTIPSGCYTNTTYNDATTSVHGLMSVQSMCSLTNLRVYSTANLLGAVDGDIAFINV